MSIKHREIETPHPIPLHPNSGLPEFGTLRWAKSDISDFGGEREQTELAAPLYVNFTGTRFSAHG
jgi:hypothetical protein